MNYKIFKPKKRDVVQYIIVLAVVAIILAFAFPKIRDKMGSAHNATMTNINTALDSNMGNDAGVPQPPAPPQPTTITEDFSDASYNFPITGSWYTSGGQFRGQSIDDSDSTNSSVTINIPSGDNGSLDFDYSVSSEQNFDFLTINLDGSQIVHVSGSTASHYHKTGMASGNHILTFIYSKDYSYSQGSDTGFIDNLTVVLNPS